MFPNLLVKNLPDSDTLKSQILPIQVLITLYSFIAKSNITKIDQMRLSLQPIVQAT